MLLLSIGATQAQSVFSTYSRFGIGQLAQPGSMTHFGMGGVTTPIVDGSLINLNNPASYSFCGITTLQVSAVASSMEASTANSAINYNSGQVNEFAMLFKKPGSKWAFAAGLSPYSSVNYSLSRTQALNDSVTARYIDNGTGGLNRMTLGTSRSFTFYKTLIKSDSLSRQDTTIKVPIHQLSFGLNMNLLFGTLLQENLIEMSNATFYNTKQISKLSSREVMLEGGLIYRVRLAKKEEEGKTIGESHLYVGVDYQLDLFKTRSRFNEETSRYLYSAGVAVGAGSTYSADEMVGSMYIPERIALGVAYRKSSKKWGRYTLGLDCKTQDWSRFDISIDNSPFSTQQNLKRATTFSAGIEYEPSIATNNGFLHRLSYRAGVRKTDSHLNINNTAIAQQAISAGISIPVVRSLSRFHIGAEYVTGGTHENDLVLEKGFNFIFGFTLTPSERWFYQRKYD